MKVDTNYHTVSSQGGGGRLDRMSRARIWQLNQQKRCTETRAPSPLRNMSFRGENEKSQICRKGRGGGSPTITNNRVSDAENGTVRK